MAHAPQGNGWAPSELCDTEYATYMRIDKGNKPNSVKQTGHKLRRLFTNVDLPLSMLTPALCEQLYEDLRRSKRKPQRRNDGTVPAVSKPISVDYHRNALSEAKTFLNWCVKRKWISTNPLIDVEGMGRRRHGKEQLRIDEARKWLAKAIELGAIAAMMTLLMGHALQRGGRARGS